MTPAREVTYAVKTRVYLDNCCYNRPFDDSSDVIVRLEAEAKMYVQQKVRSGELELAWSFILEYENEANPYEDRKDATAKWKQYAAIDIGADKEIFRHARHIAKYGIRDKDALHIACAIQARCRYFLTTDKRLLKKKIEGITLLNPLDYVQKTGSGK